jgi:glucokinase
MDYVIGVDLGGTQLRAILADPAGTVYTEVRVPTEAHRGPSAVIERIIECIVKVQAALPADGTLLGVGIGTPGPLDPDTGVVFTSPNMPGWHRVPLRDILIERTGLLVELGNDANVAALGEWRFGGGAGHRHFVYITVSTGIGGGVVVDGQLLLGRLGAGAELGHIIINYAERKSWEELASGTGVAAAAALAMQENPTSQLHDLATPATVTAAHVALAASRNDPTAQALMQQEAMLLGIGFVSVLHLFSPERIMVGGSVITSNPYLLEGARQVVQERAIADVYREVPIEVATLGDQVGVLGAVALLLYQREQRS